MFDLAEFSEEQQSAIKAEIDRRVTSAVQTTTKRVMADVTQKLQEDYEAKMQQAVAQAQQQATMSEEEKIQNLSKQLEAQQQALLKSQMEYKVERKLRDAGLADEAIENIAPLIVAGADPTSLDNQLDTFVQTQHNIVEAALQKQKETLAANVTPPAGSGGAVPPQNPDTVVNSILNDKDLDPRFAQATGIQVLLDAAMGDSTGV